MATSTATSQNAKSIDRILEVFYSFAAVPVLLGALFKITHSAPIGSPNAWLYIGLGTEAIVFFVFGVLAFTKPAIVENKLGLPVDDDEFVKTPVAQKSSLVAIDDVLKQADITPESLDRLSTGFKSLEASVDRLNQSTGSIVDTEDFAKKLKDASTSLTSMNAFYNKLTETSTALADSADDAVRTKEQIALLAQNLAKINQVYGNMLSAMNVKQG